MLQHVSYYSMYMCERRIPGNFVDSSLVRWISHMQGSPARRFAGATNHAGTRVKLAEGGMADTISKLV